MCTTIQVVGNTIKNVHGALHASGLTPIRYHFEGIEVADAIYNATIRDNHVTNISFGYGIYFGGGLACSSSALIVNNTVRGAFDYGLHIDCRSSASAQRTTRVILSNNRVEASSPNGVNLVRVQNVTMTGNVMVDSGSLKGVGKPPACVDCVLEENTATGDAPRHNRCGRPRVGAIAARPHATDDVPVPWVRPSPLDHGQLHRRDQLAAASEQFC